MALPRVLAAPVLCCALMLGVAPSATAAAPPSTPTSAAPSDEPPVLVQPPSITASLPASAFIATKVTLTGVVTDAAAAGAFGPVSIYRDGVANPVAVVTPAADGSFSATLEVGAGQSTYRAVYANATGQTEATGTLVGVKAPSTVSISAPSKVIDEKSATVSVRWVTSDGRGVTGKVVLQRKKSGDSGYSAYVSVPVAAGNGSVSITPRYTYRLRASAPATALSEPSTSSTTTMNNVPPGKVWKLAPKPSYSTPVQQRDDLGPGANATISKISASRAKSMKGRSWRSGCTSRSTLRLVKVNYWGFDGYRHRGEIIVHSSVAPKTAKAFTAMYAKRYPIYRMYAVDRFGYSKKLRGADDYKSMKAGNTSGFNCRGVVGSPSIRSPHASGKSIDINPWWNPYHSRTGITPNKSWDGRKSPKQVTYRSRSNPVVKLLAKNGWRWHGNGDKHHFYG